MRILYFARLRELVGRSEETLTPPNSVTTIGALLEWLKKRDEVGSRVFAQASWLRIAVNQEMAGLETPIQPGDEIALFPPMTGG
jgi:molybdopterin synthase sulfur carrier subunit